MNIDSTLTATFVGAVITIAGTFVVRVLQRWREAQASRQLLAIEIDENLRLLNELREHVNICALFEAERTARKRSERDPRRILAGEDLTSAPFASYALPTWPRTVWSTQSAMLVRSLNSTELRHIHRIFTGLDKISRFHELAKAWQAESRSSKVRGDVGMQHLAEGFGVLTRHPIERELGPLWDRVGLVMNDIRAYGNPLKSNVRFRTRPFTVRVRSMAIRFRAGHWYASFGKIYVRG